MYLLHGYKRASYSNQQHCVGEHSMLRIQPWTRPTLSMDGKFSLQQLIHGKLAGAKPTQKKYL